MCLRRRATRNESQRQHPRRAETRRAPNSHSSSLDKPPTDLIHLRLTPVHVQAVHLPPLRILSTQRLRSSPRRLIEERVADDARHGRFDKGRLGWVDAVEGCEVLGSDGGVKGGGDLSESRLERGGREELPGSGSAAAAMTARARDSPHLQAQRQFPRPL